MGKRIIRSGVYQVTNEVNGKCYIGSSKDIINRWSAWRAYFKKPRRNQCILWDAVRKYGIECFTFIILEECECIKETLLAREQHYIDTLKPEYNIMKIAGSRLGSHQSAASIAKVIASLQHLYDFRRGKSLEEIFGEERGAIIRKNLKEASERNCVARFGKSYVEIYGEEQAVEITRKMSLNNPKPRLGIPPTNKGIPSPNRGVPMKEETKQKVSASKKGKPSKLKGVPRTEETRQKNSESTKMLWNGRLRDNTKPYFFGLERRSKSGHFGITWRNDIQKWTVRIINKKYGTFSNVADALKCRDQVMSLLETGSMDQQHQTSLSRQARERHSKSGHFGITWRNDNQEWSVQIGRKKYGAYANIADALERRSQVMLALNMQE
jgi:group I intron endonuclease